MDKQQLQLQINLIDQVVIALQYKTDRMQTRPHIQFNRGAMRERSYPQKKQNSAHKMVSIQTKLTKRTQNKLHSLVLEDTKKQKIHTNILQQMCEDIKKKICIYTNNKLYHHHSN